MHFEVEEGRVLSGVRVASVSAKDYTASEWSTKEWSVLEGKKVNGAGRGYFEYTIKVPSSARLSSAGEAYFLVEASAKQLFVKDQEDYDANQDFMKGSRVAPSSNPNAYPMSDETMFPSEINIRVDGRKVATQVLPDDPADHRGILSWHHQLKDRKLREAGSYGYLIKVPLTRGQMRRAARDGQLTVRLETERQGGIAIYGKSFGRYPFDPCLVIK